MDGPVTGLALKQSACFCGWFPLLAMPRQSVGGSVGPGKELGAAQGFLGWSGVHWGHSGVEVASRSDHGTHGFQEPLMRLELKKEEG